MSEAEKKSRGRKRATKAECRRAFTEAKNRLGLEDLQLQYGPDTGRCSVVRVTVDEDGSPVLGDMLIEGMAGNSFVDACKVALILGWESTVHPKGHEIVPHDDVSDSDAPEALEASE